MRYYQNAILERLAGVETTRPESKKCLYTLLLGIQQGLNEGLRVFFFEIVLKNCQLFKTAMTSGSTCLFPCTQKKLFLNQVKLG